MLACGHNGIKRADLHVQLVHALEGLGLLILASLHQIGSQRVHVLLQRVIHKRSSRLRLCGGRSVESTGPRSAAVHDVPDSRPWSAVRHIVYRLDVGALLPRRTSYLQQDWQWLATNRQAATLPSVCCSSAPAADCCSMASTRWPLESVSRLLPPQALRWAPKLTDRLRPLE